MADVNRSDFVQFISLPVQWGDMDSIGHVNNAIYFRYIESGRIAYFNAINDQSNYTAGVMQGPILADIQCSFIGQLKYPEKIDVGTRTSRIGTKSFTIEAAIFAEGEDEPRATSRGVVVWFDYTAQKTIALPDAARARILEFEKVPPEV